jgi:hypothetical protein
MPTAPADRVDAELRYAWAAPLIRDAALWVDLGCGDGVAAGAAGLGSSARTVLVDRSGDALASARRECGTTVVGAVEADLGTAAGVAAARAAADGAAVITCFDLLAELEDFTALVGWLTGVEATVLLSVPDSAGATSWSASAAEELRRLLPAGTFVARQVPVRASAIVLDGATASAPIDPVPLAADLAAAHHLLAFGPAAERLVAVSAAAPVDVSSERTATHHRDADVAYLEARLAQLEA